MISIIIILYRSKEYISNCLDSINKNISLLNNIEHEIILIDNEKHSIYENIVFNDKCKYHKMEYNLGFSKALNYGVGLAKGEYILSLNPDTILYDDSIKQLLSTYNYFNRIGVVGGKIMTFNNKYSLSTIRKFPTPLLIIKKYLYKLSILENSEYNYTHASNKDIINVDCISGCCIIFKKSIFTSMNGYDERFFLYFEDTDFCTRLNDNNYKVLYNPKAIINHYKGGSIKNDIFHTLTFYISAVKFIIKYYYKYKLFLFISLISIFSIIFNLF